jgi:hypothetical protein
MVTIMVDGEMITVIMMIIIGITQKIPGNRIPTKIL